MGRKRQGQAGGKERNAENIESGCKTGEGGVEDGRREGGHASNRGGQMRTEIWPEECYRQEGKVYGEPSGNCIDDRILKIKDKETIVQEHPGKLLIDTIQR